MKIALIGYGKMGKVIEAIALERGHEISARFSSSEPLTAEGLAGSDVAIEFSIPDLAVNHMKICLQANCPVVVGTTGWYSHFQSIESDFIAQKGALLYATNFSMGVNITFFINKVLARIMAQQTGYKVGITEIHHTKKLDAPSGTAISIAEGILAGNSRFSQWKLGEGVSEAGELHIQSIREGEVPGTHTVTYQSEVDTITLTHEAHNRTGFALGSVIAAEWLVNKKGVYTMQDMLNFDALIQQ